MSEPEKAVPGRIVLDIGARPIFVITMEGELTDEVLIAHHTEIDAAIAEWAKPFCLVYDIQVPGMSAEQRRLQLGWIGRFQTEHLALNRGVAFVHTSRLARGVIRTMHWAARPLYAYEITADLASARAWCKGQLAARPS